MAGNTLGRILRLMTFGESHGPAIGGVIEGFPAGLVVDMDLIRNDLSRRRPGQSRLVSPRNEPDEVELLSGIFEGKSLGTPIGFIIRNRDQKPADYQQNKESYRPSHADFTYDQKYGHRDHRGGGRSSARETATRVVAGSFAKMLLKQHGIHVSAYVHSIGPVSMPMDYQKVNLAAADESEVRCPDPETSRAMVEWIENTRETGDTLGGVIACVARGVPPGLGEPVFDRLHADLAKAMMSINAVKGFDIGSGFGAATMKGSEHNDKFISRDGSITTETNFSGGVQGGISNGMDIYFRVAFKPVATLMREQRTLDSRGNEIQLEAKGRHDVSVVPRAVPIVEAMAALVIADHWLMSRMSKI
ncbi:MAG: chorismate synthase [bacterium]|jgi:chorismate synthase